MVSLLVLLAVLHGGNAGRVVHVDLIELNHLYRDGQHTFDQFILYDWSPDYRRYHAICWAFPSELNRQLPKLGESHRVRLDGIEVRAKLYRETWTTHDPERQNLTVCPEQYRRKLATNYPKSLEVP